MKPITKFYHLLLLLIVYIMVCSTSTAQELPEMHIVGYPEFISTELVANSVRDADGVVCAGLIVQSNLDGLIYEANNGVVDIDRRPGSDFLYIQESERLVTIYQGNYQPLEIILNEIGIRLEKGRVWQIKITGEKKHILPSGKGDLELRTIPEGVKITVVGYSSVNEYKAPTTFNNYFAQPYQFHLELERYESIDTVLSVYPDTSIIINIALAPVFGELEVYSDPSNAQVYIDDTFIGNTPMKLLGMKDGLDAGNHSISIQKAAPHKDSYRKIEKIISVDKNEKLILWEKLNPITGTILTKSNINNVTYLITDMETSEIVYNSMGSPGENLLTGDYKIEAKVEDYSSVTNYCKVIPNQQTMIEFEFSDEQRLSLLRSKKEEAHRFAENFFIYNDVKSKLFLRQGLYFWKPKVMLYYLGDQVGIGTIIGMNAKTFSSDLLNSNLLFSFYWGVSFLGNLIVNPQMLIGDVISINFGTITMTPDFENRLFFEIGGGLIISYPIRDFYYNGRVIVRTSGPDSDNDGNRIYKIESFAPAYGAIKYERYLGSKIFFTLEVGVYWGPKLDWFYKDELDEWESTGGEEPHAISDGDLPGSPFIEGWVLYVGVGIRF